MYGHVWTLTSEKLGYIEGILHCHKTLESNAKLEGEMNAGLLFSSS